MNLFTIHPDTQTNARVSFSFVRPILTRITPNVVLRARARACVYMCVCLRAGVFNLARQCAMAAAHMRRQLQLRNHKCPHLPVLLPPPPPSSP